MGFSQRRLYENTADNASFVSAWIDTRDWGQLALSAWWATALTGVFSLEATEDPNQPAASARSLVLPSGSLHPSTGVALDASGQIAVTAVAGGFEIIECDLPAFVRLRFVSGGGGAAANDFNAFYTLTRAVR